MVAPIFDDASSVCSATMSVGPHKPLTAATQTRAVQFNFDANETFDLPANNEMNVADLYYSSDDFKVFKKDIRQLAKQLESADEDRLQRYRQVVQQLFTATSAPLCLDADLEATMVEFLGVEATSMGREHRRTVKARREEIMDLIYQVQDDICADSRDWESLAEQCHTVSTPGCVVAGKLAQLSASV